METNKESSSKPNMIKDVLKNELQRRQQKNPAYSLRAFAKHLRMSPAQLSQLISGKRVVTLKTYQQISALLNFSPLESLAFLDEISNSRASTSQSNQSVQMSEDQFRVISDWWYMGILSLAEIEGTKKDPEKIARRLGVSEGQVRDAIERLERLEILDRGPMLRPIKELLRVVTEVPSAAIQKSHRQMLELASDRLGETEMEKRDYSTMTMAISTSQIPKARKMIEDFQEKLLRTLETGTLDEVYTFSCQLFPLTQGSVSNNIRGLTTKGKLE